MNGKECRIPFLLFNISFLPYFYSYSALLNHVNHLFLSFLILFHLSLSLVFEILCFYCLINLLFCLYFKFIFLCLFSIEEVHMHFCFNCLFDSHFNSLLYFYFHLYYMFVKMNYVCFRHHQKVMIFHILHFS